MKFLIDECMGNSINRWLLEQGLDSIYIGDTFPGIDDDAVLEIARHQDRILITCDKDFGEFIFQQNKLHVGIIFFRLKRPLKIEQKIKLLQNLLSDHGHAIHDNYISYFRICDKDHSPLAP